jgi:predicted pyridoxine 5'-phosphate oxidase superfamily flavin-nucleotide-binding protein
MALQLTADMRAVVDAAGLCFAVTVTPDGRPNLSPKGTVGVWDESHLYFCDIASPGTRANLEANPWIELNLVDQTSRRGYRFFGTATLHREDDVYRRATGQLRAAWGHEYDVECVVLVEVLRAAPLISPGYQHVSSEWQMRALWKARRAQLDRAFEEHLKSIGTT